MKKLLLLASGIFLLHLTYANIFTVQVANFSFSPSTINANVGDTIVWSWVSGVHTTTSTSVPVGAASWNSPMDATNQSFTYKLTTAGKYTFICVFHAVMVGTINVSEVLPVTLVDFNIVPIGKGASIQWRTANEQNIAVYNIKRSNDGTHFTDVGQVKAVNKTGMNTYNFNDNTIATTDKYLYYFLDIMDKDGAHTASAILSFKNAFAKNTLLREVMPNPVNGADHLMLEFYADKPGKMLVQLFSANGNLVKQAEMDAIEGINNAHFHTGALAAGTYLLQCTMDGKKETKQVVVH